MTGNDVPVSRSEMIEITRQIGNMRFGCSLLERKKEALFKEIEADRSTFRAMRKEVEGMLAFVSYAYALVRLFEGESVKTLLLWGVEPRKVRIVSCLLLKNTFSMITTLSGYRAPMSALSPVGINFRLQVLSPLANTNIRIDITKIQRNCLAVGNRNFLCHMKKTTKQAPAMNCLI